MHIRLASVILATAFSLSPVGAFAQSPSPDATPTVGPVATPTPGSTPLHPNPNSPDAYTFAGIAWGSSPATYRTLMVAKGYTWSGWSDDRKYMNFDGKIGDVAATMAAYTTENGKQVQKFFIIFENGKDVAQAVFDGVKAQLVQKYGPPSDAAAELVSWGPENSGITLRFGDDRAVLVTYYGPGWSPHHNVAAPKPKSTDL